MFASLYRTVTSIARTTFCDRYANWVGGGILVVGLCTLSGCSSFWGRSSADADQDDAALQKLLRVPDPPDLVRTAAVSSGLKFVRVDGVGVVNALPESGGPAQPSLYRDQLLEEMKRNDIVNPNLYLERADTALVRVQAIIPPGAKRGDRIDVTVAAPNKSEARDLHGGWLLDTRLRHQKALGGSIRSSEVMAIATGPVLTRFDHEGRDDAVTRVEGRLLSAGVVQSDRQLGLILRPEFQHVKMATAIAAAINERFYFFDGSTRRGIAEAVEDDFIKIDTHPRYRGNEFRLMTVLGGIGVAAESSTTQARLVELGQQLRDVATAADAAIQLEGLGEGAIPTLIDAAEQSNPELRFYASEALAYLDRPEAIEPLLQCIRDDPAFRAPALEALRRLQHPSVDEALTELMSEPSLEIRYGAFDAMRCRDETIASPPNNEPFQLFQIPSPNPAIIASLQKRPEIVIFGNPAPLKIQTLFRGPGGIMIREAATSGKYRLTRFQPGKDDVRLNVDATLPAVLAGMVQAGGGYGDAVAFLRMAKTDGVLTDPLALDPLPKHRRTYHRDAEPDDDTDEDGS